MNNLPRTFFNLLSEQQQTKLINQAALVHYADRQLIHSRGDRKPGLSIVKKGTVKVGVGGADGTFILTTILGPGECFGEFTLFTDLPRTHDIFSQGSSQVYQIPQGPFFQVFNDDPGYSRALLKTTLMRNHQMLELFDAVQRKPLREKIVQTLLLMLVNSGNKGIVSCRQSDLASTLGTSRVSMGKELKILQREGLISLGYGKIHIPDTVKLQGWLEARSHTLLP